MKDVTKPSKQEIEAKIVEMRARWESNKTRTKKDMQDMQKEAKDDHNDITKTKEEATKGNQGKLKVLEGVAWDGAMVKTYEKPKRKSGAQRRRQRKQQDAEFEKEQKKLREDAQREQ